MTNKHVGSCLCEQVQFEIEGDFESFFLCHCKYCQKDTGSAHAANLFSTQAKLTWITGSEKVKTFNLPSTRHYKSFCEQCGSALPNLQIDGKLIVTPAGSLDTLVPVKPNGHIFISSKANWDEALETVTKFKTFPS